MKLSTVCNIFLFALSLNLYGCGGNKDNKDIKQTENTIKSALTDGIWQSQTHGFYIQLENEQFTAYDVTQSYCIKSAILNQFTYDFVKKDAKLTDNNELELGFHHLKILPIKFDRVNKLPVRCESENLIDHQGDTFNPILSFNIFWENYQEHFAYQHINQFDWQNRYQALVDKISNDTTEPALILVIDEILSELKDGHSYFSDGAESEISYSPRAGTEEKIHAAFSSQDEIADIDEFYEQWRENHDLVLNTYIDTSFNKQALYNGKIELQKLNANLAYLSFKEMYGILGEGGIQDFDLSDDVDAIHQIMDSAITAINTTQGLIIDLRFNPGGHDHISLNIFSHFINSDTYIARKRIKTTEGFTDFSDIEVKSAAGEIYLGPIVVLVSDLTTSAAEVFALALLARDNVTFIGENTNGSFSDSLAKSLPNGWTLALSNEQYQDMNGNDYESIGIPVQYQAALFDPEALEKGNDLGLEKAIDILSR